MPAIARLLDFCAGRGDQQAGRRVGDVERHVPVGDVVDGLLANGADFVRDPFAVAPCTASIGSQCPRLSWLAL
ncbi:MAG: hypothetical protein U0703_24220 [Anaerolineae bacterium]